mgnify:CR=1 FL=1
MMMSINDIIYINEAAKALKQKQFLFYKNCLIGLDYIDQYVLFLKLDESLLSGNYYNNPGIKFVTRDLSKFVKTLTIEHEFEIDYTDGDHMIVSNMDTLVYTISRNIDYNTDKALKRLPTLATSKVMDVTEQINPIKSLKKADGVFNLTIDDYIMLIPSTLLPLSKPDKVSIQICDIYPYSYTTKFIIYKKKFTIMVFLSFLKFKM